MKTRQRTLLWTTGLALVLLLAAGGWWQTARSSNTPRNSTPAQANKPALTVSLTRPFQAQWPVLLGANGTITPWQETSVGAEVQGLRLTEVRVNTGDQVRQGQVLAVFSDITIKADVAQAQAQVAEAEAVLAEARANAGRARQAQASGVMSAQQISEYLNTERTATARLDSARAQLLIQQTRLRQTQLTAPDDGVISARSATVGAVVATGQELFRLIRQNRLEWRAEVTAAELPLLAPGQEVTVTAPGGLAAKGQVRVIAPLVDPQTRMGLAYVDIPPDAGLKAGMFAHGEFQLPGATVLALPQSAVLQRDGFSYVFQVEADHRVRQTKVATGRRQGRNIEITAGLAPEASVVATGAAFLADGDLVRVVTLSQSSPERQP